MENIGLWSFLYNRNCRCARSVLSRWPMFFQYGPHAWSMIFSPNTVSFNSGLTFIFVRRSRLFRLLRFDRSSSTNCRTPLEETVNTRGTGYFQLTQDEVRKKATRTFPAKKRPSLVSRQIIARHSFLAKETPVICFLLKKRPSLVLFPPKKSPVARCLTNTLSNQRLASVSYSKFTASLAALLTYEYVTLSRVSV